jgi:DNA-binding XRE family transcriptional regulator
MTALTLDRFMERFAPEEQASIRAEAQALLAQIDALAELRRAQAMTQETMAGLLGVSQEAVSRMERRTDMLLSTLTSYVEAIGGSLKLVVEFPGHPPTVIRSLGEIGGEPATAPVRRRRRKSSGPAALPAPDSGPHPDPVTGQAAADPAV